MEHNSICPECKGHYYTWTEQAWTIPESGYVIHKGSVKQVCKSCRRYIRLEHSSELFLQGWLPSKSKQEWRTYHDYLFATVPKHIAAHLYHEMRTRRYEQQIQFNWEDQFSPREVAWLNEQFLELTKDLDCVDNYRAADRSKKRQRKRYWKKAAEGCCGSKNVERFCPWNLQTYILGCNYGH
jgi:hypothetical protein